MPETPRVLLRRLARRVLRREAPTYSDRGFAYWEPVEGSYGAQIDVHESSAAMGPHLWISVDADCHLSAEPRQHPGISHGVAKGNASAHLSLAAAKRFRHQLDAAIKHSEGRFDA